MPLNFTAIDFETANFERGSVCSVGVAKVVSGQVQLTESWFVSPPTGPDFTNTYIHGIGPLDVIDAPDWATSLDRIESLLDGGPLVAYSAFDKGVYNAATSIAGIQDRGFEFLDVLAVVRQHVDLQSYRLPLVIEHFGLPDFEHHDAAADALACAQITLHIAEVRGLSTTDDLWRDAHEARGARAKKRSPRSGTSAAAYQKLADLPGANLDADPAHPLFGEVVCFSGDLDGHTRSEAQALVAGFGATVSSGVTKKTTLVVMGGFDPATLKAGATLSSKVQRAIDLASSGQRIEIVTEQTFLELIEF